jgi:Tfp pilus assembly protein PilN
MIQINLLPKEYRKKSQFLSFKKGTAYALAVAGALVVLMLFATAFQSWKIKSINTKIVEAKERTEKLKKDIQIVDALTEVREKLLQRMTAIENLDKYRTVWIKIMEDLSSRIPAYLWLSGFKEELQVAATNTANNSISMPMTNPVNPPPTTTAALDTTKPKELNYGPRRATLDGYCYSINSLAAFLINLNRSNYIKNVEMKFIRSTEQDKHKIFAFQLACDLIYYIEPPSFAQAEQKGGPSPTAEPTQTEATPPTGQEPSATESEKPGQSSLIPESGGPTLAKNAKAATPENQKIIP